MTMPTMMQLIAKHYGSDAAMPQGKRVQLGGLKDGWCVAISRMRDAGATPAQLSAPWKAVVSWPVEESFGDDYGSMQCNCPFQFRAHAHRTGYFTSVTEAAAVCDAAASALAAHRQPSLPKQMSEGR